MCDPPVYNRSTNCILCHYRIRLRRVVYHRTDKYCSKIIRSVKLIKLKKIVLVAGARPNFMKIAPIIDALQKESIDYALVHTGQHYDAKMSEDFFVQLQIPKPDINLESGGGSQAEQTASIMIRFEKYLMQNPCDLVLVVGDVTSTLACSIVAKKLNIKVAHVEGGIRSRDMTMPEEINRIVTDSISDYFFTTSVSAGDNLRSEGKNDSQIFFVGNTMIDTLLKNITRFEKPGFWNDYLQSGKYLVLTLHRPSNVDDINKLKKILTTIETVSEDYTIVFPIHPRTKKTLEANGGWSEYKKLLVVDPQGYLQFNYLVKNAKGVITDSGGITEETTVMGIPCMTLRDSTERPETCTIGTNELIGTNPKAIAPAVTQILQGKWKKGGIPELWDGHAAARIASIITKL